MKMVISILNLKGGAGKSTVAVNLSAAFAIQGEKVLLVDTDKQGSSEKWNAYRPEDDDISKVTVISLTETNNIRKEISGFEEIFDIVIIDGAPKIDAISSVSISFSDIVLIPVTPSPPDLWATQSIVERVKDAQEVNGDLKAYFLINRDNPITKLSHEVKEALDVLKLPVLKSKLNHRIAYPDAMGQGLSVLEWSDVKAQNELKFLVEEIRGIMENSSENEEKAE